MDKKREKVRVKSGHFKKKGGVGEGQISGGGRRVVVNMGNCKGPVMACRKEWV